MGRNSNRVLEYAYLNSHYQSGLKNLLDVAVLDHVEIEGTCPARAPLRKVDELPFDFSRRRMSVVLATEENKHVLICKGAVEEMFAACTSTQWTATWRPLDASHLVEMQQQTRTLNADGFRVIAVAYKDIPDTQPAYHTTDESGSDPTRLYRLPRSSKGERRDCDRGAGPLRGRRSKFSPATTTSSPAKSAARLGS